MPVILMTHSQTAPEIFSHKSHTYKLNDAIVHVVAIQKLAMPVAGGVPCVGSTFLFSIMVP